MHDHARPASRNEQLVLACLETAKGPLGAYDILDKVKGDGIRAPLQVYRALEKLQAAGIAHRVESLNAFVACAGSNCHLSGTVSFGICTECGQVEEFSDNLVKERLDDWASSAQFLTKATTIELRGLCAACVADSKADS